MRNLKRVLSLALAAVMLMGMMVMGTSAASVSDFDDADQISNVEAATITTAIGIFSGYGDGTFRPGNIVTRAEMAAIICKMLYGADVNGANFSGVNIFSDVTQDWQIGYVNLCNSLNIVNGYGNGTFQPDKAVNTAEAALMICKALGYFKNDADYGSNWELASISKATQLGLFGELRLSANAGLTRDSVSVMVFNALANAVPVEYNATFGVYYPQYGSWTTGIPTYQDIVQTDDFMGATLGYKNLHLVRSNASGGTDEYGRPAVAWGTGTIYTSTGGTNVTMREKIIDATNVPVAVYTSKKNSVDLSDYTWSGTAPVAKNGVPGGTVADEDDVAGLTANGTLVEVYADTNKVIEKVVMVETIIGTVTSVSNAKKTINITAGGKNYTIDEDSSCFDAIFGNVAVKDRVMVVGYTKDGDNYVRDAYLPESVTGTITFVNNKGNSATVDGRNLSADADGRFNRNTMVNTQKTMYLDKYGYVREVDNVAATSNEVYLYLTNLYKETVKVNGVPTVKNYARGVLEDGTVTTIEIANVESGSGNVTGASGTITYGTTTGDAYIPAPGVGDLLIPATGLTTYGTIVELKEEAGKNILVYAVNTKVDTVGADITANARTITPTNNAKAIYFAENVQFVYVNGDKNNQNLNVSANAVNAVNSVTAANVKGVIVKTVNNSSTKLITAVYVDDAYTTTTDRIYLNGGPSGNESYVDANGVTRSGYRVSAWIDGEKQTIITTASNGRGFYTATMDGEAYVLTPATDNAVYGMVATAYRDGITVNNNDYIVGDARIVDCTDSNINSYETIEELMKGDDKIYVSFYYNTVNTENHLVDMYVSKSSEIPGDVISQSSSDAYGAPANQKVIDTGTTEDTVVALSGTVTLNALPASGNNSTADGTFNASHFTGLAGKDYFVLGVCIPGSDGTTNYAVRVTSSANAPSSWTSGTYPWGATGTNDTTLYEGVKRFVMNKQRNNSTNALGVLALAGSVVTVEVMLGTDIPAAARNNANAVKDFDDAFVPTYTITIDCSGVTAPPEPPAS